MAAWPWEVGLSIARPFASHKFGDMAVVANTLWVSVGGSGANVLWYTVDGAGWDEEDMTTHWTDANTWNVLLCEMGGDLYAIRNFSDAAQPAYPGGFEIWKRETSNGTWSVVATSASRVAALHAHATVNYIMILGTHWQYPATAWNVYVWRYDIDAASLVEEYHYTQPGFPNPPYEYIENTARDAGMRCGIYLATNGAWYFSCYYREDATTYWSRIRRRVSVGNWVVDHDEGGLGYVGRFDNMRTDRGIFCAELHYTTAAAIWQAYNNSADKKMPRFWHVGGHELVVDESGDEYVAKWTTGTIWETTGALSFDGGGNDHHYITDIMAFKDRLFLAADKMLDPGDTATFTFRIISVPVIYGLGIPPFNRGDSKALVCDHQYGDTLYIGLRDESMEPIILWLDWDFDDFYFGYDASAGSAVGVQTVETRDECFGFGQFGVDKQIILSEDKLLNWDEAQGEFGDDEVTTLQFHPTNGEDLTGTRRLNQDLMRTLNQRAPWASVGPTPFVARSQLRVADDIWIGSDVANAIPVRMYNETSGSWMPKSTGLPTNVAINDLELGF